MNDDLENPSSICFSVYAGGIWEKDILFAEIEESEKLDASKTYPRKLNAKEVMITQKDREFIFLVTDRSAKLSGRTTTSKNPFLDGESPARRENLSGDFQGDREEFQPEETIYDEGINVDFLAHAEAQKEFI